LLINICSGRERKIRKVVPTIGILYIFRWILVYPDVGRPSDALNCHRDMNYIALESLRDTDSNEVTFVPNPYKKKIKKFGNIYIYINFVGL